MEIFPDFHKVGVGSIIKRHTEEIATTMKEIEEVMITTDGVKRKLDGVVDSRMIQNGIRKAVKMLLIVMIPKI